VCSSDLEAGLDREMLRAVRAVGVLYDEAERTYDAAYVVDVDADTPTLRAALAAHRGEGEYAELVVRAPAEVDAALARAPGVVPTTRALWALARAGDAGGER
jgi:hypothetical protein